MHGTKPPYKSYWIDAIVLTAVMCAIVYVTYRVNTVLVYNWDWSFLPGYVFRWDEKEQTFLPNLLIKGLLTTIRLAVWSILLASVLGLIMGIMRTSRRLFPRMLSRLYVELIRNVPPIVFIFVFYFFISSQISPLLGLENISQDSSPVLLSALEFMFGPPELLSNVISGIICLALFEGAYVTEIVRSGIQSVSRGQTEAGMSIGLTKLQLMRYVTLPQAFKRVIPPLANQFIILIKDSSILSLISIQELTFLTIEVANSTQRVFEVWIFVAGVYLVICYACALVFQHMEKRLAAYHT
ncbi:MAG: amino acid ABC transporter permease [SAR324 cluster bacterium]|jgi:polar amino acid transport system permease protein|nr:amino acid ABC transporter permease [Deltaproteobacteria bacterium]MDP6094175.1 amino acid ABC transporter permease [SAR324 cluster bacterium]MDP6248409.1 amino acid ABC transporter permease [SAR324 cluster bacterium]MDP6465757.1 amino acid ABC transporter permease [SAR324 cluster bacterium]MDP7137884.1 amino acid ABC transporter permease [SAR324 cluster bacterium]|tara:strand:- start:818 stop:1708 length:891 start_codon:yes stop_codon:yes gene_type:complete